MNKKINVFLLIIFIFFMSCKAKNDINSLNYMQNVEQVSVDEVMKNRASTIQKGDQLAIFISAKDMSVVKPFNQNYTIIESAQYSAPNTNSPMTQVSERNGAPIYIVNADGYIDFPILGKLSTIGKSLTDFQDEIRQKVSKHVINPTVSIRLVNFKVTVLGEVNKPGQYTIPDGNSTILNALGLAGDITMYGKRDNILLVRYEDGNILKERIDLNSDFINSPYFQLKQNDVIYVSANETKEKVARQDPNTNIYIAVAGMVIGLAGIFITIFKK